jgi:hypothetical protein
MKSTAVSSRRPREWGALRASSTWIALTRRRCIRAARFRSRLLRLRRWRVLSGRLRALLRWLRSRLLRFRPRLWRLRSTLRRRRIRAIGFRMVLDRWHNDASRLRNHRGWRIVVSIRIAIAIRAIVAISAVVAVSVVVPIRAVVLRWRNIGAARFRIYAAHIAAAILVVVICASIDGSRPIAFASVYNLPTISAPTITVARVIHETRSRAHIAVVRRKPSQRLNFAPANHDWIISAALRQIVRSAFRTAVNIDNRNRSSYAWVTQNWARNRMIPGRPITNIPACVCSAPPPGRASGRSGGPAPAKPTIKIPGSTRIRQVAPVLA